MDQLNEEATLQIAALRSKFSQPKKTTEKQKGSEPLYPWDKWMQVTGKRVVLKEKDYSCQLHSMCQQIRRYASKYHLRVSVFPNCDTGEITFVMREWAPPTRGLGRYGGKGNIKNY